MEKKNRVFKLLGVLVVVFLVCLCLLGSTFARYTTGSSGSGEAYISKWKVTLDSTSTNTVTIGELSPMLYNESTSEEYYRTNASSTNGVTYTNLIYVKVAEMTIEADVDAAITMSYDNIVIASRTTGTYYVDSSSTGSYIYLDGNNDLPTYSAVFGETTSALQLGFAYATDTVTWQSSASELSSMSSSTSDNVVYWSGAYGYALPTTGLTPISSDGTTAYYMGSDTTSAYSNSYINTSAGASTTISIYAYVLWTSDYNAASDASTVDSIDTWIGNNVASISADFTYAAVQAQTITYNSSTGS